MSALLELDRQVFSLINGANAGWLDQWMSLVSGRIVWIPIYVLLFIFLQRKLGWRQSIWMLAIALLGILIADQFSSSVLKPLFGRLRPCHDPSVVVRLVTGKCGGQFGFVSSHASNFSFLAIYLFWSLPKGSKWLSWMVMCIALMVGYSRIYLGVHFPGDVLGGFAVGALVAIGCSRLFKWCLTRFSDGAG
jgi:undecaprenyl-diphosphatase